MSASRNSQRWQDQYKNNDKSPANLRKDRSASRSQLRKEKRLMQLSKRRNVATSLHSIDGTAGPDFLDDPTCELNTDKINDCLSGIHPDQPDPALALASATEIRVMLADQKGGAAGTALQYLVSKGVIPMLVHHLDNSQDPKLMVEIVWALTNIAAGTGDVTEQVVRDGAIPRLVELLSYVAPPAVVVSDDDASAKMREEAKQKMMEEVREQAVWALGNIAADNWEFRDAILEFGVTKHFKRIMQGNVKVHFIRVAVWAMSVLCKTDKGAPEPPWDKIVELLPILAKYLYSTDGEILKDATWALSYFSASKDHQKINTVIETGVCRRLCELLLNPNEEVIIPALRAIGNISTGTDQQTQVLLFADVLASVKSLLLPERGIHSIDIKWMACWVISNIMAGSREQKYEVLHQDLIPYLVNQIKNGEFRVKKEAAYAILAGLDNADDEQILYMCRQDIIPAICDCLLAQDNRLIAIGLSSLTFILDSGERRAHTSIGSGENEYTEIIEECHGLDHIEALQHSPSEHIYSRSLAILEKHFAGTE